MPKDKKSAVEETIRKLDVQWGEAASRKDLKAVVSVYAPDGTLVWPGSAPIHGTEAIHAAWKKMMKTPGLSLRFLPERIDIAEAGDLAIDFGVVKFGHDTGEWAHLEETAKYVVVWKLIKGDWKVLYDFYSMNSE